MWLVGVNLDYVAGLTVVAVAPDGSATPLAAENYLLLFPTRSGLRDFLHSGEPHSLWGKVDDFDPVAERPEETADPAAIALRAKNDPDAWWLCQALIDTFLPVPPGTLDDTVDDLADRTWLREEFERAGYRDVDHWLCHSLVPVRLTVPSGTGFTLLHLRALVPCAPRTEYFLGGDELIILCHREEDLLDYLRAPGNDRIRTHLDRRVLPHVHPLRDIDLTILPGLEPGAGVDWESALCVLDKLAWWTPSGHRAFGKSPLRKLVRGTPPQALKERDRLAVIEQLAKTLYEVDQGVVWR